MNVRPTTPRQKGGEKLMGGGTVYNAGGGRSAEQAEDIFKKKVEAAKKTSEGKESVRNVFISFHTEDESQVNLLREQAKGENQYLEFRDYSVKEPFDEKWRQQCRDRISQTSATIVMIGPETADRPSVNWEIEESYRQGKKVIGVRIYRDKSDPVPQPLREHRAPVVDWNLDEIQRLLD